MKRYYFKSQGLTLSYLDSCTEGQVIIALHAHWMEAKTFINTAQVLATNWRIIALDQRGHGDSEHARTYTRADYIADLNALIFHLELTIPVILLGNSLGGINSYYYAAQYPKQVRGMIIEDVGVEVITNARFALSWCGIFETRDLLAERIGPRLLPYLEDSFRQVEGGWKLAFSPEEIEQSIIEACGDHWSVWLASTCPALIIGGNDSQVTDSKHLQEMASRRPHTLLRMLPGGHVLHMDTPQDYCECVQDFLVSSVL